MVRLMGDDLRLLDQELAKLATYLGADSRPTLADLEAVSWQADAVNIFTLVDAIGKRQQSTALKLLERMLTEGADPSGLLAMIARQMRIIFMIKALAGSGNMAQQLNLHPFVVKQCQQQAKGFQRQARERIFKALFAADLALKNSQEPKLVLEGLVTELCG